MNQEQSWQVTRTFSITDAAPTPSARYIKAFGQVSCQQLLKFSNYVTDQIRDQKYHHAIVEFCQCWA
ncbi:DNA polymerase epsilon catalytic subunit [Trichinella pseudospiralis]